MRGILVICTFWWTQLFLVYYFSQCEKMTFDYCVPRYKYTFMCKTLCKLVILCDPHFNNYHFGPHKYSLFLSSFIQQSIRGDLIPSSLFFLSFSHLLLPFFSLSLPLSKVHHGSSNQSLEPQDCGRIKTQKMGGLSLVEVRKLSLKAWELSPLSISQALDGRIACSLEFPRTQGMVYICKFTL